MQAGTTVPGLFAAGTAVLHVEAARYIVTHQRS